MDRYDEEDYDDSYDHDYHDDDDDDGHSSYTVAMKGHHNMAKVQWGESEQDAIEKTAREWGCKPEMLYIYRS